MIPIQKMIFYKLSGHPFAQSRWHKISHHRDCNHEMKRCLLLGREAVTNLGSILKSRNITLPTKVRIVKAMNAKEFIWTVVLDKAPENTLDSKEIKQSILKEINPEYSLEGLMLKLQYFGHLIQTVNSLDKSLMLGKIEGRRRRGHQRMRWLDGITNATDMIV